MSKKTTRKLSNKNIATISVLLIVVSIGLLCSNYLLDKKRKSLETVEFNMIYETEEESLSALQNENKNIRNNKTYTSEYIGILEIPKISLKKGFVPMESENNTIRKNIQIIEGSSYPDVEGSNFMIAAHSGNSYIGFFNRLQELDKNDPIYIEYKDIKYTYQIKSIYTQEKTGTIDIYRNHRKNTVTLITCTNSDQTTQTIYIAEIINKENI